MNTRGLMRLLYHAFKGNESLPLQSGEVLEVLPSVDNQGTVAIGDGTTDVDFKVFLGASSDYALFDLSAGKLEMTSAEIDLNGNELILDADADTSITADTDDEIDVKVGGTDVLKVYSTGFNDRGVEAITATTGGGTTGLITAGSSSVTITSDNANKQVSLPAASVGDRVTLYIQSTGCEVISAVSADKINEVVVGATNELALVAPCTVNFHYFATDNWSAQGWNTDGTALSALTPDTL